MKATIKNLAACLIVLLAACTKQREITTHVTTKTASYAEARTIFDPCSNPINPYDSIGRLHNIVLESLRHYVKSTKDTTREGKASYLSAYFLFHYGKKVKPVQIPDERKICLDYKSVMLKQDVSKIANGLFTELSNALDGIKDLEHYDDYRQQVIATENKIFTAPLSDRERTNLLMTASLLRYSGYYWMEAYRDGEVKPLLGLDGIFRKIIGVIAGIGADATVIAYSYFLDPINIVDNTVTMSELCGYYTGWY